MIWILWNPAFSVGAGSLWGGCMPRRKRRSWPLLTGRARHCPARPHAPDYEWSARAAKARQAGISTPVILITALGELYDRIEGLDAGADDYIVKPFAFEELTARIRSLGRRSGKWEDDNLLTICDISYDCNARLLSGSTGSIRLSGREGRLLEVLLRSFELVIRREVLLSRVWGVDAEVEDCNLDTYIHYLRKRLSYVGSTLALKPSAVSDIRWLPPDPWFSI